MDQRLFGKELTNLVGEDKQKKNHSFLQIEGENNRVHGHSFVIPMKNQSKVNKNRTQLDPINKTKQENIIEQSKGLNNMQMIPAYFQDILHFLKQKEQSTPLIGDYIRNYKKNDITTRNEVLNWLSQLHFKYKMFPETIFTVTSFIDRYLSKVQVAKQDLQLVGAAAFYLSAKYEQTYQVPQLKELARCCGQFYSPRNIVDMQAKIVKQLNFQLITSSSFTFFDPLSRLIGIEQKNYHLCQYVLQLSLMHTKFLNYAPSLVASACIYLIKKIRKSQKSWSKTMTDLVGYQQDQLRKCARDLCHLLEDSQSIQNCKAIKKKFSLPCFHQVTRIRLQRKSK